MTRSSMSVVAVLNIATLSVLAACASTPLAPTAASTDCTALASDIARAAAAQSAAEQERNDAWKTPLPIAAVARFGHGAVGASQSQQRLDELRSEAARLGCSSAVAGNGISTSAQGQGLRPRSSLN